MANKSQKSGPIRNKYPGTSDSKRKDDKLPRAQRLKSKDPSLLHEMGMTPLKAKQEANLKYPESAYTPLGRREAKLIPKDERLGIIESFALAFEPKKPIFIHITTPSFGDFKLDSKILPEELKGMSKEDLAGIIAKKIEAGGMLYQKIIAGEKKDAIPEQSDISNLMWFLQAKAENMEENGTKKVGVFTSGAISLEDPDLHLTNYLSKSKEIYQRDSSHIEEFQKVENGVARGIDFNPGYFSEKEKAVAYFPQKEKEVNEYMKNVLPYDKGTLMISPMLYTDSTGLIEKGKNRVLLKMEYYGCASPRFKNKPVGFESRKFDFYKDLPHVIGHAWEFLLSLWRTLTGSQNVEGTRKERVPPEIKNAYKKLIEEARNEKIKIDLGVSSVEVLEAKNADILKDEGFLEVDPFSDSGGIRIMYSRAKYLKDALEKVEDLNPDLLKEVSSFCEMLEKRYSKKSLEFRIGDEVVLNQDDLKSQSSKNSSFNAGFL